MFYDILDEKRLAILPLLKDLKKDFYLAGGTALALQIGHRDSVDFDFFSQDDVDTKKLFEYLQKIFQGHHLHKIQEEANTLTVLVDSSIKISFFAHAAKLVKEVVEEESLSLASMEDIACMKLSAITSRATSKDYIDIYFLLRHVSLSGMLEFLRIKYPELETNLVLKSLVYFDDVTLEKIRFKHDHEVAFEVVQDALRSAVKNLDYRLLR